MSTFSDDLVSRFWAKVDKSGECWIWTGAPTKAGYGLLTVSGKRQYVHRISYEIAKGPIPEGLMIDHVCHHRMCVNPEHLRAVTVQQNAENLSGAHRDSKSGVLGVWQRRSGRWAVQVMHDGVVHSGGGHATKEAAEAAAIELRNRLFTHNELDRLERVAS